ncbi:MAG: DinB family protein [Candidatus Acidoferrales bacterium]
MKRVKVSKKFRQYMRRMKGYVGRQNPLTMMATGPQKLARAVRGLTAAQLRRRPRPGKWSIREIVTHLADTELTYAYRLRAMLAEPGSTIVGYDQDRWNRVAGRARRPLGELLEQIRVVRHANLRLLRSVPRPWWSRYGMHTERGRETVSRMVWLLAGHDVNHRRQIQALRRQFGC